MLPLSISLTMHIRKQATHSIKINQHYAYIHAYKSIRLIHLTQEDVLVTAAADRYTWTWCLVLSLNVMQ